MQTLVLFFWVGGGGEGVSTSIIAPKHMCSLQELKGCMLFYGSYTSRGPAKTLCPLRRIGPQYSLLIIKWDKGGKEVKSFILSLERALKSLMETNTAKKNGYYLYNNV